MPTKTHPNPEPEGTAPLPRTLLDALVAGGFDVPALARGVDVEPQRLESGLTRLEADRFLCAAWQAVGDPAVGLEAGSIVRAERLGVSGLAAMTSPDFGTALMRKARYNRLVWGDDYEVTSSPGRTTVVIVSADESRPYGAAKIDMELASLVAFGRHFTGVPLRPLEVTLRQARPASAAYRAAYEAVLGIEPVFACEVNRIVFDAVDAARPLLSANRQAHAGLVQAAEAAASQLEGAGVVARARHAVQQALHDGEPSVGAIASRLLLSERTLQRRLAAEGLNFSRLVDDSRRQVALERLRLGSRNVAEVAFVLGFADLSSFYRAFKRWTGTTPEGFRRDISLQA